MWSRLGRSGRLACSRVGAVCASAAVVGAQAARCEQYEPIDARAESRNVVQGSLARVDEMIATLTARVFIAPYVDHTILSVNATPDDVRKLCQEAVQFGFQAVCVNGCNVKLAQDTLKSLGSDVKVCAVVGFPLGASASSVKSFETLQAIEDGASEIDMVVNVGRIKAQEWDYVLRDISDVVSVCKQKNVVCKVILETCMLTDEEKKAVSRLSALAGADFVKTSTGFSTGGATVDDVRLMYGSVRTLSEIVPYADGKEPEVQVKASGGIRSVKDAEEMLRNGATRLGTSRAAGWCQGSSGKKQVAESTY